MSIDIKNGTYVYLRYYEENGKRVNLYLGKVISSGKFEAKEKAMLQASEYFYQNGLRSYKIGELLESDPLRAIRVLTKKETLSKSELEKLSLSPSAKLYKSRGEEVAEGETRRRQIQKTPEITTEDIVKISHNTLTRAAAASPTSRKQFDERLEKIKKKKSKKSEEINE